VTVEVPVAPWATERAAGDAASVKLGAWIVKAKLAVSVRLPEVPVIVTGVVAETAELLTVSVSTLVPVVGLAPHDAVTPAGNVDVTARLTLPVKPPASATVMVEVPVAP